ncbi:helix-turn-helix domain-containing protein [Paenibacillus hodogayensis]|uniref:Helix-turn-helix domain-containing protein n=1 Tax=Paenibacillus hodogayensis TaxID=279208 RepID=A0ABV5VNZ3_9BACL
MIDYRWRAWLVFSLLLGLGVAATAAVSYRLIDDHMDREVQSAHMALLREVDSKVTLVLRAIDDEAIGVLRSKEAWEFMERDFASSAEYSAFLQDRLAPRLNGMLGSSSRLQSVELYSYAKRRLSSGSSRNAAGELPDGYGWVRDFERSPAFASWLEPRLLPVGLSGRIGSHVITLVRSYPIVHADGYRKGAIAVHLQERALYDLIREAASANSGSISIVNADGLIVSHADKGLLAGSGQSDPAIAAVPSDSKSGMIRRTIDGAGSNIFYYTSPYTGWTFVSAVPELLLNEGLLHLRNALLSVCIVLVVLASLAAMAANRWTLKPVNRLVGNMSKLLQARRPWAGKGEEPDDGLARIEEAVSGMIEDCDRMLRQMNEHKPAVKWRLAMDMLSGARKHENPLLALDAIGCRLHAASFVVMSLTFDRKSQAVLPEDDQADRSALCQAAEERMNAGGLGIAVETGNGVTAAIMSFGEPLPDCMSRACEAAERIRQLAEHRFGRTVTIGIGAVAGTVGDIRRSFSESSQALDCKMMMGSNTVIRYEDVQREDGSGLYRLLARTEGVVAAVKAADRDKTRGQAQSWFAELSGWSASSGMVRQLAVQLMLRVMAALDDMDIRISPTPEEAQPFEALRQCETVDEVESCIGGLLDEAVRRIAERRGNRERHEVVETMLDFIRNHYARSDLSLSLLADECKQSVYHLSRIFKEHTGGNFIDYVLQLRVEKAKTLLGESGLKVLDIAGAVGYTNLNSFVRIFKKSTGFTPTEFREQTASKRAQAAKSAEL